MKCVNCKNLGKLKDEDGVPYDWCEKVRDNPDIQAERKCKHYVVASHADKLRAMSDEELAEMIAKYFGCAHCPGYHMSCDNKCLENWLCWLKQEASE